MLRLRTVLILGGKKDTFQSLFRSVRSGCISDPFTSSVNPRRLSSVSHPSGGRRSLGRGMRQVSQDLSNEWVHPLDPVKKRDL